MDIYSFIAARQVSLTPVFILQRDITVTCYLWELCSDPKREPVEISLKAGTELLINNYSNFGDGWSMRLRKLSLFPKGVRKRADRWFVVKYADMEYSRHIISGDYDDGVKRQWNITEK